MSRSDEWGFTPESQIKAVTKYNKEHTTTICIRLNTKTDKDILQWLWGQKSKQGSIKQLIRKEIERQNH